MTVMTPTARPTVRPGLRLAAAGALVLSLVLHRLPLRHRVAVLRPLGRARYASPAALAERHEAVLAVVPRWWPGRIACTEVAVATVLACALSGRRADLVYGARFLPDAAHAWVEVPGAAAGRNTGDAGDRPWTPVAHFPERVNPA
ncbi:lasso peptide biosynthesis B2 protein [Streptomyces sp. BE20]|uniref:lasso peptide biosynthesis B2 protein n=1 Tax=Streptomyces sp. BE20 TaxID=3002525 RepID=UPI002E79F1ED|nr:lasso peptide biosynthesis B2 protein [Streptomyces sp. BE20]MEE1820722.1 lasso peptide biosynthesis B2 protein [Streptomyces sp. BE20]